jgi:aryl-alcohol dehydrogenase-like predicted oxidoreductase
LHVSALGQGTGQFGTLAWGYGVSFNDLDITSVIRKDLELGINLFDTAETYGGGISETQLGKALSTFRRDDYFLVSKVAPWNLTYEKVIKAANRSLERLGTSVIDLYLIHYPNPLVPLRHTLRAMETLVRLGKVKFIGVSNFSPLQLNWAQESMRHCEIVANEIEYNLVSRRSERKTIPYCIKKGIGVIAYSPLAGGVLTGRYSANSLPKDRARAFNLLAKHQFVTKLDGLFRELAAIAHEKGLTIPQVALSWITSQKTVVPIPASLSLTEVESNAKAVGIALSQDEVERLRRMAPELDFGRYYFDHFALRPISWAKATFGNSVRRRR